MCVLTMQVSKGSLKELGEAGSPRLSWVSLLTLKIRGLLMLQLQIRQLQHQGLLPHCPLVGGTALREGP